VREITIGTAPACLAIEPSTVRLSAVSSVEPSPAVRIVRCGGMSIAVPRAEHAVATRVATTAVRLVHDWGLVNVAAVLDRARALGPAPLTDNAAWDVLVALPRTHWLDREQHWFAFTDASGRFEAVLDKIFVIVERIRFDELRAALGRALIGARQAPAAVLRRCLVELGGCTIVPPTGRSAPDKLSASLVERARPDDPLVGPRQPRALTHPEATVVDVLAQAGGEVDARTLRLQARTAGVARTTVNELIKSSPLLAPIATAQVVPARLQRVRLIGRGPRIAGAR
jgi:hypothetical protein